MSPNTNYHNIGNEFLKILAIYTKIMYTYIMSFSTEFHKTSQRKEEIIIDINYHNINN